MVDGKKPEEKSEKKKKRPFRKAYLDDFHRNVAGEYIYTGPTRAWGSPRGRTLRRLWPLALLALAAAVAGGCIPGCGMEQYPWSLVPYTVTLVLSFVQAWKLYKLTEGGDPVREYVWKSSAGWLPPLGLLTAASALVTAAAELVNLFLPGFSGNISMVIVFLLLKLTVAAASLLMRRTVLRLEWA